MCSSVVVLLSLQKDQKSNNKSTFIDRSMGVAKAISASPDVEMWCIISSVNFYFSSSKFLTALQDFKLVYLTLLSSRYYFNGKFKNIFFFKVWYIRCKKYAGRINNCMFNIFVENNILSQMTGVSRNEGKLYFWLFFSAAGIAGFSTFGSYWLNAFYHGVFLLHFVTSESFLIESLKKNSCL